MSDLEEKIKKLERIISQKDMPKIIRAGERIKKILKDKKID